MEDVKEKCLKPKNVFFTAAGNGGSRVLNSSEKTLKHQPFYITPDTTMEKFARSAITPVKNPALDSSNNFAFMTPVPTAVVTAAGSSFPAVTTTGRGGGVALVNSRAKEEEYEGGEQQ